MKKNSSLQIVLLFLIVPLTVFCQIQPEPKSYQKIKFVYQKKSNIKLDEKGLYADTTQLKMLFPEVEYEKINSNTGNIIGFVPHSKLNRLNQKTIAKKMTENNTVIFGLVDLKKNNVLFSIDHSSPETDVAYQLFKLPQNKLNSSLYYTYKKKFTLLEMNSNATTQVKSIVKNKIRWQNDNQTIGHYDTQDKSEHKQLNVVIFQEDLPRLVSPIPLFDNAKAGIKTIYAMEYHYELIAVSYE